MIYRSLSVLMDAWAVKCRIANGRPWSVGADVRNAALNAIMGFAFRPDGEHNANRSMREVLNMRQDADDSKMNWQTESPDEPIDFPSEQMSYMLQALIDLTETVMEIHGSPLPELQMGIHQFILGEKTLADRDGRATDYFSRVIFDELFGVIFAGAGTTATTLCWLVKLLTDNPNAQRKLRDELQPSFRQAQAEERDPTVQEVTSTRIPYLDATIEEVLRCACTSPFVDQQATVDTELLGHRIPRGPVALALLEGPSMKSPAFDVKEPPWEQQQDSKPQEQAEIEPNHSSRIKHKAWDPQHHLRFPARAVARTQRA
ncbi:MAG: hypothetical protein Q9190_007537 [Brigantiaea leucoxantha]